MESKGDDSQREDGEMKKTTYMGTATWTRIAKNRSDWECHQEDFIQQWMDTA